MTDLDAAVDSFDESLRVLFQHLKRPATWQHMISSAGVQVDRPSAVIIHILSATSSSCKLNDLAEHLGIEAPSVTRKTQQLERDGLIRRRKSDSDKRSVYLEITAKGRKLDNRLRQARRQLSEEVLSSWSKVDRQQFINLFSRYTAAVLSNSDSRIKNTKHIGD